MIVEFLRENWTEILGFGTGLLCVFLASRRNVWNFPIGLANNVVFIVLFLQVGLYADTVLQLIYVVLGVWGWIGWTRARAAEHHDHVDFVRTAGVREIALYLAAGAVATAVVTAVLVRATDSTAPLADAFTTCFSLVAQIMLNRRVLQSWWVWIVVDVVYVGLFAFKELWITAGLYAIFVGLAVSGYIGWRRHRDAFERTAAHA